MNWYLLSVLLALDYSGKALLEESIKGLAKLFPMMLFATITVILQLIIVSKRKKITFANILMTWFFALGISYVCYPVILEYIPKSWHGIVIGAVVLTGEKIVTYAIYKAKIDDAIVWLLNLLADKIKSYLK